MDSSDSIQFDIYEIYRRYRDITSVHMLVGRKATDHVMNHERQFIKRGIESSLEIGGVKGAYKMANLLWVEIIMVCSVERNIGRRYGVIECDPLVRKGLNRTVPYITTALMDAKLGTKGHKDLFDWLSRQLSGLSDFPDTVGCSTQPIAELVWCLT
ncbi:Protein MOR1 [Camellia lanceoleosa]|uniref:Protein MOR1 n=1 Tax=Camellia lanceoleosa TaxID=1840588 RepID=A0ACC0GH30_9ERIC|nr:Protein MOR1 [Camellia lanceoleosa]